MLEVRDLETAYGRSQVLFGARRYSEARAGFAAIRDQVNGDNRELADLRAIEAPDARRSRALRSSCSRTGAEKPRSTAGIGGSLTSEKRNVCCARSSTRACSLAAAV